MNRRKIMINYYEVKAKCGHVGKMYYYEGTFYEIAGDGRQAAARVRFRPRVKHHHKDAILTVKKITKEEYLGGKMRKEMEIYYQLKTRKEQDSFWGEIQDKVFPEQKYLKEEKEREHKRKRPYKRKRFDWKKELLEVA